MGNANPEQALIDLFYSHLSEARNDEIAPSEVFNKKCRSKKHADVDYMSKSGVHWLIEAKSNATNDAHNSAHKLFGELLKETGRACKSGRDNTRIALLIPKDSVSFYRGLFKYIRREKFIAFGALVPVFRVFLCGDSGVEQISWDELYPE